MSLANPFHNTPATPLSWWLDSLLLIALIGLLFGSFLGSRALMVPDEGRYAEIAREMVTSGDYVTPQLNNIKYFEKPPFFYWLESAFIKAFGMNEWNLRLPPALFGLIGCLFVYLGTRKLFNRRSGLLAGLLLASSGLYFTMSHFITPDIVFTVLLTGSLLAFLLGVNEPVTFRRNIYFLSMYALAALATLTKGLIGILFPGMIIFLWLCCMQEWRILKQCCLITGLVLFLLIAVPWHLMVQNRNPEFFQFYFIDQHVLRYFTNYAQRRQPLWFFPTVVVAGFFPWVCFLVASLAIQCRKNFTIAGWRQSLSQLWRQRQQYRNLCFVIIWAVSITVFFTFSKSLLIAYALPVMPPLAILVALYLSSVGEKTPLSELSWPLFITAFLLFLGALIGVIAIHPNHLSAWYMTMALLFFSSILLGMLYFYQRTLAMLIALFFCISACLISLNLSFETIDSRSTKPLVADIKPLLPNTTLIAYQYYYPDLSFYLQQHIIFANYTGELAFGLQHQNHVDWALDKDTFIMRWLSPERIVIIARRYDYDSLRHDYPFLKFYELAQTSHDILLMNQPL